MIYLDTSPDKSKKITHLTADRRRLVAKVLDLHLRNKKIILLLIHSGRKLRIQQLNQVITMQFENQSDSSILSLSKAESVKNSSLKPLVDIIGKNPKVNAFAANWNEQQFCIDPCRPGRIESIIKETEFRQTRWGYPPELKITKDTYAIARDQEFSRWLILKQTTDINNQIIISFDPIGEYDGENLGLRLSERGKGVGQAFVKELIRRNEIKPSIGYSPRGIKTVVNAWTELKKEQIMSNPELKKNIRNHHYEINNQQPLNQKSL